MIYDFVIIGAGPIGSTLAKFLSNKYKVCIIDKAEKKKNVQNLPYGSVSNKKYQPVFSGILGGNSELWNNKVFLMTKNEFDSGIWNFDFKELFKNSELLRKKLNISKFYPKIEHLKETQFKTSISIRTNLNNVFNFLQIKKNKNIDIIHETSPIYFDFDSKKKNITSVILKNKQKKISRVFIKKNIIFACGGLGNAHVVLNLLHQIKKNIPKIFFKDHAHVTLGNFKKKQVSLFLKFAKYFITKKKIEKNIYLETKIKKQNFFTVIQLSKNSPDDLLRKTQILDKKINFFKIFRNLLIYYFKRIYFFILNQIDQNYAFEFAFSENVNHSTITLSKKKDEFGFKKINVNWNLNKKVLLAYINIINFFLKKNNFKFDQNNLTNDIKKKLWSGQHPSCSTPINSKKNIVGVDKDLKFHNFENIYICGSSVFPINGFTNPTWTAMVLSFRLANHLLKKHK